MGLSGLGFMVEEAAKNVRRNGLMSLAALTTVTISLAVLGGAVYALFSLHRLAATQPERFEVEAFLTVATTREQAREVARRVERLPDVRSVRVFPREVAWAQFLADDRSHATHLTAAIESNPLPDRLDVRVKDPARTRDVAEALRKRSDFPEVHQVRDAHGVVEKLVATSRLVRNVGGVAAAVLFLATALVIQNTLRLTVYARRREIRIMQLVGATAGFIRLPLVLEGLFYGVVGALLAAAIVLFLAQQTSAYAQRVVSPLAQAMPPGAAPGVVVAALVAAGIVVGWGSSLLSMRRFLGRV